MTLEVSLAEYRKLVGLPEDPEEAAKHEKAVEGGHKAKQAGDAFHAQLDLYHAHLMATSKIVRVFRQHPTMKSTWMNGRLVFVMQRGEKGPCDYGFILRSGLSGIFDAKSYTEMEYFTWSTKQEHQLEEMRIIHAETNGRSPAFALVNWASWGEVRIHPIWTVGGPNRRTVYRKTGTLVEYGYWLDGLSEHWKVGA